jgi:hypothetical protein
VTEFHFHDKENFIIHVDYFSSEALKTQFEELLKAYRDDQSLLGDMRTGDEDAKVYRDTLTRKASLALATFKTSFGDWLGKESSLLSTVPFDRAIEKMIKRVSQLLPSQAGPEPFSTIEACSIRLRELVSEPNIANADSPTYWPFIRKVRVYLKAHILSKGLIIADLPGLRDLNSARKAITERYVLECHQIFIVADISRAITDESIKDVFELASSAKLNKVDIVCTMADNIELDEIMSVDWPAEKDNIERLQQRISCNKPEIEEFERIFLSCPSDFTGAEFEDHVNLKKSNDSDNFDLLRIVIGLRNDKVKSGLRKAYQYHPLAANLNVFCVGNKMYQENREKPAAIALPYLDLSGILNLRRYCIGIVAQSRLHAIRQFIKDALPALIGSVGLWVESGSGNATTESKEPILAAVSHIQQKLDEVRSTCL